MIYFITKIIITLITSELNSRHFIEGAVKIPSEIIAYFSKALVIKLSLIWDTYDL